ncbi:MAG: hypothetical protein U9O82_01170 [Thermodesulfobacteriota bacterium]|nr:hypothetical protein [Thermodesulfobacteriota bacterium]
MSKINMQKQLENFIKNQRVVEIKDLFKVIQSASRMTVFRRISGIGYICSYTHAGRYYTLNDIPRFNADGLWFYDNIGFSQHGSLKNTISFFVDNCDAGKFHIGLEKQLRIRVHNALLDLVKSGLISRTKFEGRYLYTSIDPARSKQQIEHRQSRTYAPFSISESIVIEVLIEAIYQSERHPDIETITSVLNKKGLFLTISDVRWIFDHYDVEKKIQDSH